MGRDAYLGGREEGGVGVSLVKGLPTGDDMAMDDRLDTVVGNLRLTKCVEAMKLGGKTEKILTSSFTYRGRSTFVSSGLDELAAESRLVDCSNIVEYDMGL